MVPIERLVQELSHPEAYPFPVQEVEVYQTHISVVFLAGSFAYKVKKPVKFSFLDFSTLQNRRHFCEEEFRLDQRLASDVYLGVVPIVQSDEGLMVEGQGEPVEYAVKMRRLPHEATLLARLLHGEVQPQWMEELGALLAKFHKELPSNDSHSKFGRFDIVSQNARANLQEAEPLLGITLSEAVRSGLSRQLESELARQRLLIEERASKHYPRECHGDLHLDHIYWFPEAASEKRIAIVDGIEFSERYRTSDPIADLAFLVMDLRFHNCADLASILCKSYFDTTVDYEGELLLPLYCSYRAAVRAKVEGLKRIDLPSARTADSIVLRRARAYWLFALAELAEPIEKPCLLMVGGLPGSGKSTLAQALGETANFQVIRSDVIRKELAGLESTQQGSAELYTQSQTEATYSECHRQAESLLFEGKRAIVDATFWEEKQRERFLQLAREWHVPCFFLHCQAEPNIARERIAHRKHDASDADASVYEHVAAKWQAFGRRTQSSLIEVQTTASVATTLDLCCRRLIQHNLF